MPSWLFPFFAPQNFRKYFFLPLFIFALSLSVSHAALSSYQDFQSKASAADEATEESGNLQDDSASGDSWSSQVGAPVVDTGRTNVESLPVFGTAGEPVWISLLIQKNRGANGSEFSGTVTASPNLASVTDATTDSENAAMTALCPVINITYGALDSTLVHYYDDTTGDLASSSPVPPPAALTSEAPLTAKGLNERGAEEQAPRFTQVDTTADVSARPLEESRLGTAFAEAANVAHEPMSFLPMLVIGIFFARFVYRVFLVPMP